MKDFPQIMMKRLLLYLLAGAILLAVAITADRGYKDTALLQQYAAEISAYLAGQESEAQFISDTVDSLKKYIDNLSRS